MIETLRETIYQYVARVVRWGVVAMPPDKGFVRMEGRDVDSHEPLYQEVLRFLQHYGLRSKPKAGSELCAVSIGGAGNNRICIASDTPGTGPDSQEDGEVELYAEFGQRVILDKDGQITITAKNGRVLIDKDGKISVDSASGQDIVFNGGTHRVARDGDHARGTLRVTWTQVTITPPLVQVTLSVVDGVTQTVVLQFTAAGAVTVPLLPGVPTDTTLVSEIYEGAQHVKA